MHEVQVYIHFSISIAFDWWVLHWFCLDTHARILVIRISDSVNQIHYKVFSRSRDKLKYYHCTCLFSMTIIFVIYASPFDLDVFYWLFCMNLNDQSQANVTKMPNYTEQLLCYKWYCSKINNNRYRRRMTIVSSIGLSCQ